MRNIEINTDVFALIWANRLPNEDSENEILLRILQETHYDRSSRTSDPIREPSLHSPSRDSPQTQRSSGVRSEVNNSPRTLFKPSKVIKPSIGKIRWVDDVHDALQNLGGRASLHSIYKKVQSRRSSGGRSTPKTLEAIVRRTLEEHSTDSMNFTRNQSSPDLFANPARGEWALRK